MMKPFHSFLRFLATAGLLGLLCAGCAPTGAGTASSAPVSVEGKPSLVLLGWRDYCSPEILVRFERETGVHVDYQTFEEAEEVEARLRSDPGSVDVLMVDSFNLNRLRQLRLLHPLDKGRLPNFAHLERRFLDLGCDPGNVLSVPYHWGTTLIAYRKDRIPDPVRSWKLLWDPRYKGHLMMLNDLFEPIAMALLLNGKSPDTPDGHDYKFASDYLLDQIRTLGVRYGTDDQVKDALLSGEIWASMCYSGDAAFVAEKDPQIDFFVPEEGASLWVDSLGIARDTKLAAAAHQFVNFLMDAKVAAQNANFVRYATPNLAAVSLIDRDLRDDPRIFPPEEVLARCSFVPQLDPKRDVLLNRYWQLVQREFTEREEAASQGRVSGTAQ